MGIRSTAILFGDKDRHMVAVLQALTIVALLLVGQRFHLGLYFLPGVVVAAGLFVHQQRQIRSREPAACFKAFLHNNYVGMAIFAGIVLDYAF